VIATAKLRYLGVSAQKTRLVVDQVRGRNVNDALAILRYSRKLVAGDVRKLVQSAVANAQQADPNVDLDGLVIAQAQVDQAPPMKRARAQSMGRIFPVLKRACHVTVGLDIPSKKERE
jgi:large subunit ribosomal protein L22